MTAGERDWIERTLKRLRWRLDELVERGAALYRVVGLESVIDRLEARLAAAPVEVETEDSRRAAEIAKLEARLAVFSVRPHPHYPDIIMNDDDFGAALRHGVLCKLAALRGEAPPAAPVVSPPSFRQRMREAEARLGPPANDPEPFAAREQMGMFG